MKHRIFYISSHNSIHNDRFILKLRKDFRVHHFSMMRLQDKHKHKDVCYHEVPINYNKSDGGFLRLLKIPIAYLFGIIWLKILILIYQPKILFGGFVQTDGFISSLQSRKPFLLMPWGSDILLYPNRMPGRIITKFVLDKSDYIFCDAHIVKNKIQALYRDKYKENSNLFVFPWGISVDKFKRPNNVTIELPIKIISTRHFLPLYDIATSIKALQLVKQSIEERYPGQSISDFIIADYIGNGDQLQEIKNMAKNYMLDEFVSFHGFVENELLPNFLHNSDIYLSSSLSDGTSLSLLEALVSGLIPVVSDVGANGE
ncbi:MAG: glycosyltransferase, partial [Candidatus Heimdallarchaeota archaeon]|nr:glycosyltransferase [Candidatus Heimdallarchaeota archaeon]